MVDNFECAGYTFYSKFDSGNLGKVELVRCCEGLNIIGSNVSTAANVSLLPSSGGGVLSPTAPHQTALSTGISGTHPSPTVPPTVAAAEQPCLTPPIVPTSAGGSVTVVAPPDLHHHQLLHHHSAAFVEVEYNLWTRPDCAGTPYENQNRTWFYFAVTGGRPNQIVKFNVMNLNKQAKLFSQGMHPVMRVGPAGRWERIRDKPSYSIANDIFFISFLHRAPESAETKTYYAFTFPFTYNELLEQLGNFDKRFGRHPFEWHQIAHEISLKYDASTGAGPVEILPQTVHHGQSQKKGKLAKVAKVERRSPHSFDDTARDGTGTDDATLPKVSDPGGKLLEETEPSSSMSIDDSNTSESMQQITKLVNKVKIELPQSQPTLTDPSKQRLPIYQQVLNVPTLDDDTKATNLDHRDDIYYYRELLTHSVEKRRVELLTITSFHGIQTTREDRLQNLFPDEKTPRCHTFKHKKIIFISSRVHPGETPASFVLNGFLSMLLDRRSIVSITLRRMYVFKIVPFLNPDGVYNGLYRSDTRGHNLNRVYLTPNYETQPSIYAARKLIRYYHLGTDEPEPYELEMDKKPPLSKSPDTSSEENAVEETPSATAEVSSAIKKCPSTKKDSESTEENTPSTSDSGFGEQSLSKCSTISASSSTVTLVETEISTPSLQTLADTSNAMTDTTGEPLLASNTDSSTITVTDEVLPPPKVFTEQLIPDLLPVVTESGLALRHVRSASNLSTGSSMVTNASTIVHVNTKKAPLVTAKVNTGRKSSSSFKNVMNKPHLIATTPNTLKMKDFGIPQQQQPQQSQQMQSQLNQSSLGKGGSIGGKKSSALHHKRGESKIRPQTPQMYSHFRSHRNEYLNPASQKNINISLDYLAQLDEKNDKVIYEEKSNMFLYIDLHGHASKKGVFMYGNHLPSTIEAVECMLLPRLMSLNSQHFHYDACNFSERNMYYKGKRDGLSKEGSGRVAIYKCTGLIKSYTLECNYNTGKSVNILPLRGKELATAKVQSPVPPKYTPAVFEEVGRALGPSILDLTNSNPQSRLQNSDFRTLQGLRNMLRIEVERGSSKARITNKIPKPHSKRISNQSSSSLEIAKENALQWENIGGPPTGTVPGGACSPTGGNGNGKGGNGAEPLGGNGHSSGCCSSTSGGGRQFLKGGSLKAHGGKINRKGSVAGGKGFGKKDAVKKSKILCESGVASAVVASGKKLQELIRSKDQHQVPRKKIKVSPPHQQHGSNAVDSFDLCFKNTIPAPATLPTFLATPSTLAELPLLKKAKAESKLLEECLECDDSLDAIPCCSYSLPTTAASSAVALTKLISTYSQASPAVVNCGEIMASSASAATVGGTSSSLSGSGGGASSGSEKEVGKIVKISKFSKATSAKQQSKLGKSSKANDGGKLLKKKRSLKTDSNLKRKKTRVKPALT
ncbi:uncharacterized protein LOC129770842 isoform X2 [Toxorhynchites rutilus septentrionalis]|uniref:uncharacterized protein LOC129770842 isoform X2 n=1 Tax=Toxorhynchites rutilus septentrionalis TaxID=329112 RepID=UPI0024794F56|nr:uncharacterized protein LOC129770842 isoform X2 [Toxorhynchites rutilus septentrionalis]